MSRDNDVTIVLSLSQISAHQFSLGAYLLLCEVSQKSVEGYNLCVS